MGVSQIPQDIRTSDLFHHIDMGFLNRRLCLSALPAPVRQEYAQLAKPGSDHLTVLSNDHLLVTMLLDVCREFGAPTLCEALALEKPSARFCSTERLAPCPEVYQAVRVEQAVELSLDFGKPVVVAYHTEHLVSSTGKMTLAEGGAGGYVESIVGVLHNKPHRFEIEPLVMGAPWFDHPRNKDSGDSLMWYGRDFGEILPEDIEEFSKMKNIAASSAAEWMSVMMSIPEVRVKSAFASLLKEPTKKDWGGESNDHFSSNMTVAGRRRTAAFLFKGPSDFREMTLEMCGKRADQIYRLVNSAADVSIVQHSHLIGEVVRNTLRAFVIAPGRSSKKYCLIDGQATYRILKAYNCLEGPLR